MATVDTKTAKEALEYCRVYCYMGTAHKCGRFKDNEMGPMKPEYVMCWGCNVHVGRNARIITDCPGKYCLRCIEKLVEPA